LVIVRERFAALPIGRDQEQVDPVFFGAEMTGFPEIVAPINGHPNAVFGHIIAPLRAKSWPVSPAGRAVRGNGSYPLSRPVNYIINCDVCSIALADTITPKPAHNLGWFLGITRPGVMMLAIGSFPIPLLSTTPKLREIAHRPFTAPLIGKFVQGSQYSRGIKIRSGGW
jgi:hypothetical protein